MKVKGKYSGTIEITFDFDTEDIADFVGFDKFKERVYVELTPYIKEMVESYIGDDRYAKTTCTQNEIDIHTEEKDAEEKEL